MGVQTIQKLLTVIVRADRFNEGYLVDMIINGVITAILKRLQEIRLHGE
jgi:hypothetical protein